MRDLETAILNNVDGATSGSDSYLHTGPKWSMLNDDYAPNLGTIHEWAGRN